MSDNSKHNTGKIGEEVAAGFLKKQGFRIVARNYWKKWGEIDIVVRKGDQLCFVEVKTVVRKKEALTRTDDYAPEDNIHSWKRQRLRRVIETYLVEQGVGEETDWRVDAISVYLDPEGEVLKIDHLPDIIL